MLSNDADIIVVGGGPVGLAASIRAAAAGLETVVFEPREGVIDKACGEGLMPAALDELGELGVTELRGYPFRGIRYVLADDPSCSAEGDFPDGPGRGVRRKELHRALLRRARDVGVRWIHEKAKTFDQTDEDVRVDGLTARYLVAADGLHSDIRRSLELDREPRRNRRFGIRRHYRIEPWIDRVEVHWADGAEAYVTPVADDTVGVALLYEPPGRFDELLERFPVLRERLASAEQITDDRGAGPFEQRVSTPVRGRVLLVGDAAGYLDPLTGEGVALGLATAREAVTAILSERPRYYASRYKSVTRNYFWLTALLLDSTRSAWTHRPLITSLDVLPGVFERALGLLGGRPSTGVGPRRGAAPVSRLHLQRPSQPTRRRLSSKRPISSLSSKERDRG